MVFEKTQHDVKEESVYEVHLVSLGGDKYIDVVPQQVPDLSAIYKFQMDSAKKGARFSPALQRVGDGVYVQVLGPTPGKGTIQELQVKLRRAHWFGKVQLHENNLSLDFLSSAWVEKVIKEKRIQAQRARIDEENSNKNWVLTGSTAELQSLIVRAADEPGSFGGGGVAFQKVQ